MLSVLLAVLFAALVYWVATLLGLPVIVAVVAAVITLLAAAPTKSFGLADRLDRPRRT